MKVGKIVILLVVIVVILVAVAATVFWFLPKQENQDNQKSLSLAEVMEILQNSSDYNEFLATVQNFDPELSDYFKLGLEEYKKVKSQWQEQGFEDRVDIVDEIKLTGSTYWVELKNKNQGPNLLTILDLEEKECLLVMGSIFIQAGVGL